MTRGSVRIGAELQVVDAATGRAYRATDISTRGMFLEGGEHMPLRSIQRLAVRYGAHEVSLDAQVARHGKNGAGLVIVDASPGNIAALAAILDAALAGAGNAVDERRGAPRTRNAGVMRWRLGDVERVGMFEDLSVLGAAIRSDESVEPGTRVVIVLPGPEGDGQVSSWARVVRRTDVGFAVAFERPSTDFVGAVALRVAGDASP